MAPSLDLSPWDKFVFTLSMVLAFAAAWVRVREGSVGMFREFRWLHKAVGVLALCYGVGYAAVLTGTVDRLTWSKFFSGVSMFAWILVWIYPPILSRRIAKEVGKRLAEMEG